MKARYGNRVPRKVRLSRVRFTGKRVPSRPRTIRKTRVRTGLFRRITKTPRPSFGLTIGDAARSLCLPRRARIPFSESKYRSPPTVHSKPTAEPSLVVGAHCVQSTVSIAPAVVRTVKIVVFGRSATHSLNTSLVEVERRNAAPDTVFRRN